MPVGHVWADNTTPNTTYTPFSGYNYNLTGVANQGVNFTTPGQSGIVYTGLPEVLPSAAMVTAYGTSGAYCKILGWGGDPVEVDTACFDALGSPLHVRYTQSYLAITSCLVPTLPSGTEGATPSPCVAGTTLSATESCDLACAPDYYSPSGPGVGGYTCSYGEISFVDPVCVLDVEWHVGSWSTCTDNKRTRTLECRTVDTHTTVSDGFCDGESKPRYEEPCGGGYCTGSLAQSPAAGQAALCMYEYNGGPLLGCVSTSCVNETDLQQLTCVSDGAGGLVVSDGVLLQCYGVFAAGYCDAAVAHNGWPGSACHG